MSHETSAPIRHSLGQFVSFLSIKLCILRCEVNKLRPILLVVLGS